MIQEEAKQRTEMFQKQVEQFNILSGKIDIAIVEMKQTQEAVKKYNGLREAIEEYKDEVIDYKQKVEILETKIESKDEGKTEIKKENKDNRMLIISIISVTVAVVTLLFKFIG